MQQQVYTQPGAVAYYPQVVQGGPQLVVGGQVISMQTPKYEYKPSSFRIATLMTLIICGIFSPLSLIFSIPALLYSNKSRASARQGSIKAARCQGVVAAYLNVIAIVFSIIVATVVTGLVIGLYLPSYYYNVCYEEAVRRNGGPLQPRRNYETWNCR